jgi:maltose-binding protein MalE
MYNVLYKGMMRLMYQVTINKERLQNHLSYDWWKYLLAILITVIMWSLVTAMTRPQTPPDKKVDIFLVGDYALDEYTEPVSQRILKEFPELLEVNIINIPIGEGIDPQLDMASRQKLMVMLGSQTGDIFVFNKQDYEQYAKQGAFIPLDDAIDEDIQQYVSMEELEDYKVAADPDYGENTQPRIYGIPLKGVTLFKDSGYKTDDKVISVMVYSQNMEKAVDVLKWILTEGR